MVGILEYFKVVGIIDIIIVIDLVMDCVLKCFDNVFYGYVGKIVLMGKVLVLVVFLDCIDECIGKVCVFVGIEGDVMFDEDVVVVKIEVLVK